MTKRALFLAGTILLLAALANADPIGPDCGGGNCFGSIYTLTATELNNNPTTWAINLNIDATGYTGASTNLLNAVAPKVVPNSSDITALSLAIAPNGTGDWAYGKGSLNANGCDTPKPDGFICTEWTGLGYGLQVGHAGDIYNWTWDITIAPGTLLTGDMQASIKALYVTSSGKHNGLTSAPITLQGGNLPPPPVPEPASLLLLGSGLLAAGATLRRRLK